MVQKTHLGVYGVLVKDNQILLIKKSRGPYKGKLDLPGGKMEFGETIEQALKREILEETGIKIKNFKLLNNFSAHFKYKDSNTKDITELHHIGLVYEIIEFDDSKLLTKLNLEDSLGAGWFELNKLNKKNLSLFAQLVV